MRLNGLSGLLLLVSAITRLAAAGALPTSSIATTSSSTISTSACSTSIIVSSRKPKGASTHCGAQGRIQCPYSTNTTFPSNGDVNFCRDTCLADKNCISYSYNGNTNECTAYPKKVNAQCWFPDSTTNVFFTNRACFEVSTSCGTTTTSTPTSSSTSTCKPRAALTGTCNYATVELPEPTAASCEIYVTERDVLSNQSAYTISQSSINVDPGLCAHECLLDPLCASFSFVHSSGGSVDYQPVSNLPFYNATCALYSIDTNAILAEQGEPSRYDEQEYAGYYDYVTGSGIAYYDRACYACSATLRPSNTYGCPNPIAMPPQKAACGKMGTASPSKNAYLTTTERLGVCAGYCKDDTCCSSFSYEGDGTGNGLCSLYDMTAAQVAKKDMGVPYTGDDTIAQIFDNDCWIGSNGAASIGNINYCDGQQR